jgi:DNA-directed RNA polymerase subunit RPC12/RpoP
MQTVNIQPTSLDENSDISSCPDCLKPLSFTDLIQSDGKGHCPFCGSVVTNSNQ